MPNTLECRGCAMQVPADALFCPQCGEDVGESAVSDPNERLRKRLSRVLADGYRVGAVLGAGGMGVVFLAEDLKHHRRVAMKVLQLDQLIAA